MTMNCELGFEQFAVFAAPVQTIAFGQLDGLSHGGLAGVDDAFKVASHN